MSIGISVVLLLQADHAHKSIIAAALICLGAIVDFFDGFLARKLNAMSDLGKQLDSFADIITFGIAPILLVNYITSPISPNPMVVGSLAFMLAGAYRLARFNMADFSKHFLGLPIPVAGVSLAVYTLLYPLWSAILPQIVGTAATSIFMLTLAIMMISKKKVKRI